MGGLTRQTNEIHAVVTNGLKDKVGELSRAVNALTAKQPTAKKPRRLEILLAIIAALSLLGVVLGLALLGSILILVLGKAAFAINGNTGQCPSAALSCISECGFDYG